MYITDETLSFPLNPRNSEHVLMKCYKNFIHPFFPLRPAFVYFLKSFVLLRNLINGNYCVVDLWARHMDVNCQVRLIVVCWDAYDTSMFRKLILFMFCR